MANLNKDARGFVSGIVSYLAGDKKSTTEVGKIRSLLSKVTATSSGSVEATIVSAVPLLEGEKKELSKILEKLVDRPVKLTCTVSKDAIAGIRIQIGEWIVDTTFSAQLSRMADVLME